MNFKISFRNNPTPIKNRELCSIPLEGVRRMRKAENLFPLDQKWSVSDIKKKERQESTTR